MHSYNPKLRNLCHTRAHALINGLPRALYPLTSLAHFFLILSCSIKKKGRCIYENTNCVHQVGVHHARLQTMSAPTSSNMDTIQTDLTPTVSNRMAPRTIAERHFQDRLTLQSAMSSQHALTNRGDACLAHRDVHSTGTSLRA